MRFFYVSSQKWVNDFLEQGINIKFCVKWGKNTSDTCEMISEAYGEEAVENQVFRNGQTVRWQLSCRNYKWR
jgi:hypothetical protein